MEIWKDIPGYEGAYQASSLGNIKSVSRYVRCRGNGLRLLPERILKPGRYCKSGHVSVVLGKGANGSPVHALVALTFLGSRPDNADIRHLDGNPLNNALENLSYGSRRENILDTYNNGGSWRKLTTDDVIAIREMLEAGAKGREISKVFRVTESTVSAIKHRRLYAWL